MARYEQDFQDLQDFQDFHSVAQDRQILLGRRKGPENLNVYRLSRQTEQRSVRTLMSIDAQPSHGEKVRRTLMSIDSGLTVGRGPVPRQRRYHRKRIETREGSPTAAAPPLSVGGDRPILTCSRSGDRELQRPPCIAHSVEQDRPILLGRRQKIL